MKFKKQRAHKRLFAATMCCGVCSALFFFCFLAMGFSGESEKNSQIPVREIVHVPGETFHIDWLKDLGIERSDVLGCDPATELASWYKICQTILGSGQLVLPLTIAQQPPNGDERVVLGFSAPRPSVRLTMPDGPLVLDFVPLFPVSSSYEKREERTSDSDAHSNVGGLIVEQQGSHLVCHATSPELEKRIIARSWKLYHAESDEPFELEQDTVPILTLAGYAQAECTGIVYDGLLFSRMKARHPVDFEELKGETDKNAGEAKQKTTVSPTAHSLPDGTTILAPAEIVFLPGRKSVVAQIGVWGQSEGYAWGCTASGNVECRLSKSEEEEGVSLRLEVVRGNQDIASGKIDIFADSANGLRVAERSLFVSEAVGERRLSTPLDASSVSVRQLGAEAFSCDVDASVLRKTTHLTRTWFVNGREWEPGRNHLEVNLTLPEKRSLLSCHVVLWTDNGIVEGIAHRHIEAAPPTFENLPNAFLVVPNVSFAWKFRLASTASRSASLQCSLLFAGRTLLKQNICHGVGQTHDSQGRWQQIELRLSKAELQNEIKFLTSQNSDRFAPPHLVLRLVVGGTGSTFEKDVDVHLSQANHRPEILGPFVVAEKDGGKSCFVAADDVDGEHLTGAMSWAGDPSTLEYFSTYRREGYQLFDSYVSKKGNETRGVVTGKLKKPAGFGQELFCSAVVSDGTLFIEKRSRSVVSPEILERELEGWALRRRETLPEIARMEDDREPVLSKSKADSRKVENATIPAFSVRNIFLADEKNSRVVIPETEVSSILSCIGMLEACPAFEVKENRLVMEPSRGLPSGRVLLALKTKENRILFVSFSLLNSVFDVRSAAPFAEFADRKVAMCSAIKSRAERGELPAWRSVVIVPEGGRSSCTIRSIDETGAVLNERRVPW